MASVTKIMGLWHCFKNVMFNVNFSASVTNTKLDKTGAYCFYSRKVAFKANAVVYSREVKLFNSTYQILNGKYPLNLVQTQLDPRYCAVPVPQ
jgi:hypothetical protein